MLTDTHPRSPFRRPDWRWLRAAAPQRECSRAARHDDDWARRARRLRKALDRSVGDPDHPRVIKADPSILAAYHLRLGDERRRWEVEARLLAGQDDAAIADRAGLAADVVAAYEAIFYAVRGQLECLDWVTAIVFGRRLLEGIAPDNVELIWKVVAFNLGPLALDALVAPTGVALDAPTTGGRAVAPGPTAEDLALLLGALGLPVNEASAPKLTRLAALARAIDRRAGDRSASPVFAPIGPGDMIFSGPSSPIESKPRPPLGAPVGLIDVVGAEAHDADDRLEAFFEPLRFPPPIAANVEFRREAG